MFDQLAVVAVAAGLWLLSDATYAVLIAVIAWLCVVSILL
jgi:hypothetical protein